MCSACRIDTCLHRTASITSAITAPKIASDSSTVNAATHAGTSSAARGHVSRMTDTCRTTDPFVRLSRLESVPIRANPRYAFPP
jgi:hypothetical protein